MIARRLLVSLGLILAGLVVGLGRAEVFLRAYLRPYDETRFRRPDAVYHHGLVPNSGGRQRSVEWDVEYRINSLGLRDREVPLVKPAGTYRIVWVGDSTIEGAGLQLDETPPQQLERLLNSASCRARFEVLNGGVASFSPILEYLFVKTVVLPRLQPDLVLQHFDMSDVQDDYFYSRQARFGPGGVPESVPGDPAARGPAGAALPALGPRGAVERLIRSTKLFQFTRNLPLIRALFGLNPMTLDTPAYLEAHGLVGDIRFDRYAITRDGVSERLRPHWRRSLRYLALTGDLLTARGVAWAVTVSPYGHQVSAEESEPGRRFFGLGPGLYGSTAPFRILEEFGDRRHVTVIDALPAFRRAEASEGPLSYRYDVHLNARGACVYATAVRDGLARRHVLAAVGC